MSQTNTENEAGDIKMDQTRDKSESFADNTNKAVKNSSTTQNNSRSFYRNYPTYARVMDNLSQRVVGLIGNVLHSKESKADNKKRQLEEQQQLEVVQECNDRLFERITTNLDIKGGLCKSPQPELESTEMDVASSSSGDDLRAMPQWKSSRLVMNNSFERPQMFFMFPVDNSAENPFCPRLTVKPNSLKPLNLVAEHDEDGNILAYQHPYDFELVNFMPPAGQMKKQMPMLPYPVEETELMLVDTVDKLNSALEELMLAQQIAIDVEHHSYRTFMGITCLVQMSTRSKDYIFDTLTLRDEMHILNLVLTDSKKLKIMHGADLDIEWLQRDLSVYIVNLFDTFRAAKILNMARLSLAFLLKYYLDMDVDKSLQLADWRMRPLTQELIDYARQDTHFLIYIYERMTNDLLELIEEPLALSTVYEMSTDVCRKRYRKPYIGPQSHFDLLRKAKRTFDNRQIYALRGIFEWRDATARSEDESYGYVLPNHMMLRIAETLPREMHGVLACCKPVPPLVRQELPTIHEIVLKARDLPFQKTRNCGSQTYVSRTSGDYYSGKFYSLPEFLSQKDDGDDLSTMLECTSTGKIQLCKQVVATKDTLLAPPGIFDKPPIFTPDKEHYWARQRNEGQEREDLCMPFKRHTAPIFVPKQVTSGDEFAMEQCEEQAKMLVCPGPDQVAEAGNSVAPVDMDGGDDKQLKRKHQLSFKLF